MFKGKHKFIPLILCIILSVLYAIVALSEAGYAEDAHVEVLIHLSQRADTQTISTPRQVAERLQHTARTSQASLQEYLEENKEKGLVNVVESYYVVNVIYAEISPDLLAPLEKRPDVKKIYPNESISLGIPVFEEAFDLNNTFEATWNIERVNAQRVWEEYSIDGTGVVIGIIDTGVDWEHPALKSSWRGSDGSIADYNWYDPINNRTMPDDLHGHGTHVTGIAVGIDHDVEKAIGVAPGARWIAARGIDDDGIGRKRDLLAAGEFMLAPTDTEGNDPDPDKAPHIIINAWGTTNIDDEWYHEMLQNWRSASILPVFAAGNSGPKEGTINYPAIYPEAVATGSIDQEDELFQKSSRGPGTKGEEIKPDLVAPGVEILSTVPGGYAYASGTSMAAPHVAGVAALLLSKDPTLSLRQLEEILKETAVPLTSQEYTESPNYGFGHGLVDALEAVEIILPKYTLTISSEGQGTTDPASGNYAYPEGKKVILTAVPKDEWDFKKWVINGAETTEKTVTVAMDQDKTAKAYFMQKEAESDWTVFPSPDEGVPLDKPWQITFNRPFSENEIDGIVIKHGNNFIPVDIQMFLNEAKVIVSPVEPYLPEENYSLRIFLSNNKRYKMSFSTASDH